MQHNEKTNVQLTQTPSAATAVSKGLEGQMTSIAKQSIWLKAFTAVVVLAMGMVGQAQADTQKRKVEFEYRDGTNLLIKEIIEPDDPELCLVTVYDYDSHGNRIMEGTRNCYGYEGSGSPQRGSNAIIEQRAERTVYDDKGRFIKQITNAEGHVEKRTYNGEFGTLDSVILQESSVDAQGNTDGLVTRWDYDSFGREQKETRPDGSTITTTYTRCAEGVNNCLKYSSGAVAQYTIKVEQQGAPYLETAYDHLGRELRTETVDVMGEKVFQDFYYDNLTRLTGETTFYHTGQNAFWSTYEYDKLNRISKITAPDGVVTNYEYLGFNTKTKLTGDDQIERITSKTVNSQDQVVSIQDPNLQFLKNEYDPFGNIVKTNAGGATAIMQYNKRGYKVAMDDPDSGVIIYVNDVLGNLKYQRDAKFQEVTFEYDKLNRMTKRVEPDLVSNWIYDICDTDLNPNGKCQGNLVKETTDNYYERTYFYDTLGRPTYERDNIDDTYYVVRTYDSFGRVEKLTYPSAWGQTFYTHNNYSSSGLLEKVSVQLAGTASTSTAPAEMVWQALDTDEAGRISKFKYGNEVTTTITYDQQNGRIDQIKATRAGGGVVIDEQYDYTKLGNLKQRYNAVSTLNESLAYDKLNRVISTAAQKYSGGPRTAVTVQYDAKGNITYKSDVGNYVYESRDRSSSYRPHAVSQIIRNDGYKANYTYDENGNATSVIHLLADVSQISTSKPFIAGTRKFNLTSWDMPTVMQGTGTYTPNGTAESIFQFAYNSSHERTVVVH